MMKMQMLICLCNILHNFEISMQEINSFLHHQFNIQYSVVNKMDLICTFLMIRCFISPLFDICHATIKKCAIAHVFDFVSQKPQ